MRSGTAARGLSRLHLPWAFSRWIHLMSRNPCFAVLLCTDFHIHRGVKPVRQERERHSIWASMQLEGINCLRYGSAVPNMHP